MTTPSERHYLLGHTAEELRRLDLQGELYRETTVRAFHDGGIGPGMTVLDLGCGSGDVSLTVADLVGPGGRVLGVDRGAEAIAAARAKAAARGVEHADFEEREILDFEARQPFDAIVGRFVLMHQPDPVATLRAAARALQPGGVVVMIESYMELLCTGGHSNPPSPLYHEIVRFKCGVVRGAGADLGAGARLRSTFLAAGLVDPTCRLEARLEGGPDSPYYEYVEQSVRSMLPEARRSGVDPAPLGDVDTLAERLRAEVESLRTQLVIWPVVVAISKLPPSRTPN